MITHFVRRLRLVVFMVVAMSLSIGASTPAVVAQISTSTGNSYISELSDIEIETFGDFEIASTELETYEQGEGEIVYVESPDALLQVSFFDDTDDPETTLELFNAGFASEMDAFELVGEGESGGVYWTMATASLNGNDFYHYLAVTPDVVGYVDVLTVIVTAPNLFSDGMEAAQEDVTLDGDGIFAEADIDALIALVEGQATPDAEPGNAGSGTVEPTEASRPGKTPQNTRAVNITVSEATGIELEVNEPWTLSDAQVFDEGIKPEEAFTIKSNNANGNIGFFLGDDAEKALDEFRGGFATSAQEVNPVAADYSDGVAWTLDNAILGDGTAVILYIEVREDVDPEYLQLVAVLAEPENFEAEFTSAQESLLVDGEPVFADVDYSDLEDLLSGGSVDPDATAEPAANNSKSSSSDIRRENAKLPGSGGTTDIGNTSETGNAGGGSGGVDFEAAGLLSDNEYVSPQFDTEVTWGPTWYVDLDDEEAVSTDPAGEMDSLVLVWDGDDYALLFVDISTADGLGPEDFVTYWVSDDYLAENADPDAEVLLDRARATNGAVFTRDYLDDGQEVLIHKEVMLSVDGETLIIVTLISTPDMYVDIYGDAESDIQLDGDRLLSTFTTRQIERAIDR